MLVVSQDHRYMYAINANNVDCFYKKDWGNGSYSLELYLRSENAEGHTHVRLIEPTKDEQLVTDAFNHYVGPLMKRKPSKVSGSITV